MMHNFIVYFRKGGDFLNIIEQNDLVNKLPPFRVEPVKVAESNIFTCKPRSIFKTAHPRCDLRGSLQSEPARLT